MKPAFSLAVAGIFAFVAACGSDDDSTGTDNATLTDTEFESLVDALGEVDAFTLSPAAFGAQPAPVGLALQQSTTVNVDRTGTCAGGGTTHITGSATRSVSGSTVTVSGTLTETYANCTGTTHRGFAFTLGGTASVVTTLTSNSSTGAYTINLHRTGTVQWTSGNRSGSCSADVTIAASGTSGTATATGSVTGTFCNRTVNRTF
ncbi:MAG TPA: hypothetical protein VE967_03500 [Gemmatimonadaceae bacterium]|nr:hypothetical protein [Gemmatimonadaceae bacterium]